MTNERREEAVIIALVLSVGLHIGLMFYAKPHVMTLVNSPVPHRARTAPMRVTKDVQRPDPAKIEEILDVKPARDEPVAEQVAALSEQPDAEIPSAEMVAPLAVPGEAQAPELELPVFDAKALDSDYDNPDAIPMIAISTPKSLAKARSAMPSSPGTVDAGAAAQAAGKDAASMFLPVQKALDPIEKTLLPVEKIAPEQKQVTEKFTPSEVVYEKVDERIVEAEKAAVRELVGQEKSEELRKFVNLAMTKETVGEWDYFKIMVSPRTSLQTVPKDVVIIIDASGSIGKDRMGSIRKSAKRILRSVTNSGDRFNFVAFRDKFSYAFRSWQECTQKSFDQSEAWLNNLAAHGRTDVLSTISSVLTLPRDPKRPLIALVVTDGDANAGESDNAAILKKFTQLNGGLISVYMYGVKSSANRELLDLLTRGNRGESFVFDGWRWNAGDGIDGLSERFRDPVLTDLSVIFAADSKAESYPRYLKNVYRGGMLEIRGRVPKGTKEVAFSLRGLNGATAYDGYFRLPLATAAAATGVSAEWADERAVDAKVAGQLRR